MSFCIRICASSPLSTSTRYVSRWCHGPSAAAAKSTGLVFTTTPAIYSTRFGLSRTDLLRRFRPNNRSARVKESTKPSE